MVQVLARTFSEPEGILSLVSESIAGDLRDGRFVTIAAFALDPRDASLTFANAGHGPMLVVRRDGSIDDIPSTAMPLGFVEEHIVPTGRLFRLGPGDVLVLATDGVTELRNEHGALFGRPRLESIVRENRDRSATWILDRIRVAMLEFQPSGKYGDDATLVVVRRAADANA